MMLSEGCYTLRSMLHSCLFHFEAALVTPSCLLGVLSRSVSMCVCISKGLIVYFALSQDPQYRTTVAAMLAQQTQDEHLPSQFIVTTFHPQVSAMLLSRTIHFRIWDSAAWLQHPDRNHRLSACRERPARRA